MILGTKLIQKEWGIQSAIIYIDSQAAITATQLMKPTTGHYIFDALHEHVAMLRKKHSGLRIKIRWSPGHKGIEGNEQADKQAKKAITDGSSNTEKLPKILKKLLPRSKTAIKWAYNKKLKCTMQKLWQKSKCYDRMKKSDPAAPSSKYVDLITGLPRKHTSILTQLQMGHMPLAKHLFRIGKADSPVCPACQQADEMIQHYILHCPAHQVARQNL